MKNKFYLALIIFPLISCSQVSGRPKDAPKLVVAQNVETQKYLGKWYEIARYPNSFETDCTKVTAEYGLRSDGKISVKNTCVKKSNQKVKVANGYAQVVGKSNSILAVNFAPFPLPKGDGNYHILAVGENYEYAIVGEPSGKYLWFLARTPKIETQTLEKMKQIARSNSYNLELLEYVEQ